MGLSFPAWKDAVFDHANSVLQAAVADLDGGGGGNYFSFPPPPTTTTTTCLLR